MPTAWTPKVTEVVIDLTSRDLPQGDMTTRTARHAGSHETPEMDQTTSNWRRYSHSWRLGQSQPFSPSGLSPPAHTRSVSSTPSTSPQPLTPIAGPSPVLDFSGEVVIVQVRELESNDWGHLGTSESSPNVKDPEIMGLSRWHSPTSTESPVGLTSDPVFFMGFNLNTNDQRLFHHYMVTMPEQQYKIKALGRFNPYRDDGFAMARSHKVVFQWLLIASEMHLISQHHQPVPTSILQRRAVAYRITNEAVSQYSQGSSTGGDGIIAAITAAVVMDSRGSSTDSRMVHMRGLDTLIRASGGRPHLIKNPNLHRFTIWAHVLCKGGIIQDGGELNVLQKDCIRQLREMNTWNRDTNGRLSLLRSSRGNNSSGQATLYSYIRDRLRIFGSGSHIRFILTPASVNTTSEILRSCQFSSLLMLNLVLWDYRNDHGAATHYINSFYAAVAEATQLDKAGDWLMTVRGLTGLLYQGGFDPPYKDIAQEKNSWRAWRGIDVLKVIARCSEDTWDELVGVMCGWILGFCDDQAAQWPVLTERLIMRIEKESSRGWRTENETRFPTM